MTDTPVPSTSPRFAVGDHVTIVGDAFHDGMSGIVSEVHTGDDQHYYSVTHGTSTISVMENNLAPTHTLGLITPLTNTSRPVHELLRALADAAGADGRVTVSAEFLDALADDFEARDRRIAALTNDGDQGDVNRFRQDNPSNI